MHRLASRLRTGLAALARLPADPALLRVVIASGMSTTARLAYVLALTVVAFEAGGTVAVAILAAIRAVPTVIAVPIATAAAERVSSSRLLFWSYLVRAVAMGASLAALSLGLLPVVLVLAALDAVLGTFRRPVQACLLPSLAARPADLVTANVAATTAGGVASVVGPLLGGAVLASSGPTPVLALSALLYIGAASLVVRLMGSVYERVVRDRTSAAAAMRRSAHALFGGAARPVAVGFVAQTAIRGALGVLVVPLALDVLAIGEQGLGRLLAGLGIGALVGAPLAALAVGPGRLGWTFATGIAVWGLPLVALGLAPGQAAGIACLAVVGIADAAVDVSGYSLLQRTLPNEARAAALGLFEGLAEISVGLGGLAAPLLAGQLGVTGALVACGAVLPVVALGVGLDLRGHVSILRHRARDVETLRTVDLLAPLSLAVSEELVRSSRHVAFDPGQALMREGEPGDDYYVLTRGEVVVSVAGRPVRRCGPGEGVGEIALLRRVPRSATVTASTAVGALAVEGAAFVEAVTGHPASIAIAGSVIDRRLSSDGSGREPPGAGG